MGGQISVRRLLGFLILGALLGFGGAAVATVFLSRAYRSEALVRLLLPEPRPGWDPATLKPLPVRALTARERAILVEREVSRLAGLRGRVEGELGGLSPLAVSERGGRVLRLGLEAGRPDLARQGLVRLLELFAQTAPPLLSAPTGADALEAATAAESAALAELEAELMEVKRSTGLTLLASEVPALANRSTDLKIRRVERATALAALQARLASLRQSLAALPRLVRTEEPVPETGSRPWAGSLEERLLALRLKESELLARYAEDAPPVVELRQQIEILERLRRDRQGRVAVRESLNPAFQAAEEALVSGEAERAGLEAEVEALARHLVAVDAELATKQAALEAAQRRAGELERRIREGRDRHRALARLVPEARIAEAEHPLHARLEPLEEPSWPLAPCRPERGKNLTIGAAAGGLLGLGLGLIARRRAAEASSTEP